MKLAKEGKALKFPSNGVGTFIYTEKIDKSALFEIYLTLDHKANTSEAPTNAFIKLKVDSKGFQISIKFPDSTEAVIESSADDEKGLEADKTASYWLSVDRDGHMIKYGKGYIMMQTTRCTIDFTDKKYKGRFWMGEIVLFFSNVEPRACEIQ